MPREILESTNHVLIFGAGCSAPFELPVMRNFMTTARHQFFSLDVANRDFLKPSYEEMFRFEDQCQNASRYFNRDWENIEELYTQADLLRIIDPRKNATRCESIAWAIWDVYRRIRSNECHKLWKALTDIRARNLNPIIITTNYDVLCERGILNLTEGEKRLQANSLSRKPTLTFHYPGFQVPWGESRPMLSEDSNVSLWKHGIDDPQNKISIPVIKLHGSVSWLKPNQEQASGQGWIAFGHDWVIGEKSNLLANDFNPDNVPDGFSPAIIPPMLGKTSVDPVVRKQWAAAIESLNRARRVTVIGYSFPRTDAFMLRLLSEGLKDNPGLESFTIVDVRELSDWKNLLKEMFTPVAREKKLFYCRSNSKKLFEEFYAFQRSLEGGNEFALERVL